MANVSVLTDANGKLLAAVCTDAFDVGSGKSLQYKPQANQKHQDLVVDEGLLRGSAADFGKYLKTQLK